MVITIRVDDDTVAGCVRVQRADGERAEEAPFAGWLQLLSILAREVEPRRASDWSARGHGRERDA